MRHSLHEIPTAPAGTADAGTSDATAATPARRRRRYAVLPGQQTLFPASDVPAAADWLADSRQAVADDSCDGGDGSRSNSRNDSARKGGAK